MFRAVYVSTAAPDLGDAGLRSLLEQARSNNVANGVTGLLLHAGGRFYQQLEGLEEIVTALLATIATDPRHTDVLVLEQQSAPRRDFPGWSMGYTHRPEEEVETALPGYVHVHPAIGYQADRVAGDGPAVRAMLLSLRPTTGDEAV